MNTLSLLTVHYNNLPIIPVDVVCEDCFSHLTTEKFLRKCLLGEIPLPVVRVESSQGVPIKDLAAFMASMADPIVATAFRFSSNKSYLS
jgi:hypothetical protein